VAFRRAIEVCDKKFLPCTFDKFPRGSCGDATCLLAKFLEQEGFSSQQYPNGTTNSQVRNNTSPILNSLASLRVASFG
jgi:hypothetical protein